MRVNLVDTAMITEITNIGDHHIDFAFWINPQDPDEEPDITGSMKWDGCMNWQTNPHCMAHFCQESDIDNLSRAFKWVRQEALEKLPTIDKSLI